MKMKKGNFKELFEGVSQCQECGYSIAEGENKLHNICHNKYESAKKLYGVRILSYETLISMEENIKELGKIFKTGKLIKTDFNMLLDMIYTIHFTKSMKFWDFNKPHPNFEDYIVLLWNTPTFLKYIEQFVPEDVIKEKIEMCKSNRKLKTSYIFKDEFIFLKVEEVEYEDEILKNKVIDLKHLDNIVELELPEEDDLEEIEVDEDLEDAVDMFKSLFKSLSAS